MTVRFVDEHEHGFGWIHPEPAFMQRASHALVADGRVALVDPVDDSALDARVRALGEPGAVVQLLDRHNRDGAAIARRLGVPLVRLPQDRVPGFPFEVVPVADVPRWREQALWWPEQALLLVAESIGTAPYYRAPGERAAVHPMRRLLPPRGLTAYRPERLLVGHGEGIHAGAAEAIAGAVRGAPKALPGWLVARGRALVDERRGRPS